MIKLIGPDKTRDFIINVAPRISTEHEHLIFMNTLINLVNTNPDYVNIYPDHVKEKLRMDKTMQGWVRLPILFENPNQSASWKFTPIEDGKYFLISPQRWPNCYIYLENNAFICRVRGWTPESLTSLQNDEYYEQAAWLIKPVRCPETNKILLQLSTKKWPKLKLFVRDQLIQWLDGTPDRNPGSRGLFYLRSTSQEQGDRPLDPASPRAGTGSITRADYRQF